MKRGPQGLEMKWFYTGECFINGVLHNGDPLSLKESEELDTSHAISQKNMKTLRINIHSEPMPMLVYMTGNLFLPKVTNNLNYMLAYVRHKKIHLWYPQSQLEILALKKRYYAES